MVEFLQKKNKDKLQYTFTASDDDGSLQAIMVHNGASSTYQASNGSKTVKGTGKPLEITQQMAETDNLRLVICTRGCCDCIRRPVQGDYYGKR